MSTRNKLSAVLGLVLSACANVEPTAPMPEASEVSLEGVGEESVRGTIAGEPFEAVDQRFQVVTREGRERIDLLFADRRIERCGLPTKRVDRRAWIRFPDLALAPGQYERLTDEGAFEVHYEVPAEHSQFDTSYRGIGRVEVRTVGTTIDGILRVCFADAERSCIAGSFHATPCLSRIDGRALREAPGLSDEALETVGTAP